MQGTKQAQQPRKAAQSFKEPRWLAWLYLRRPSVLTLGESGLDIRGESFTYAELSGIEKKHTWLLPKWFGGCQVRLSRGRELGIQSHVHLVIVNDLSRISQAIRAATLDFLERHLVGIETSVATLTTKVGTIYQPERYVRHSQAARLVHDHKGDFDRLRDKLRAIERHSLLSATMKTRIRTARDTLNSCTGCFVDTDSHRSNHNRKYVDHFKQADAGYFNAVENSPLTKKQIDAALTFEDATLVVAAAGSGKSSCIVGKIGFALKSGLFQDEEILALAYNKDAAKSLEGRLSTKLEKALGRTVRVKSRTFHSFGLSTLIMEKGEDYEPKVLKEEKGEEGRFIKDTIAGLLETDEPFKQALAEWMLLCPFEDPQPLGGSEDLDECSRRYEECCRERIRAKRVAGRRAYEPTIPTLKSDLYVRSLEERSIANWLLLRGVDFLYEKADWNGAKRLGVTGGRPYSPDFTYEWMEVLPNNSSRPIRVVHEHFALDAKGRAPTWMGGDTYAKQARGKRNMFAKWCKEPVGKDGRLVFIETTSAQMKDGTLWEHLEQSLTEAGVRLQASSDAIYEKAIAGFRESKEFEKLLIDFVLRFKDSGLTEASVRAEAERQSHPQRARSFLRVAFSVFRGYQASLTKAGKIDYADMLRDAVSALQKRRVLTSYRFVLVDEFQDISRLRADLVKAVLDQSPETSIVFCVGDDWQTINRFAGSDVGIFTGIGSYFGRHTEQIDLPKTFRCADGIAEVSRELVLRNPGQITKPVEAEKAKLSYCLRVVLHEGSAEGRFNALVAELERIALEGKSIQISKPTVQLLMRTTAESTAPRGLEDDAVVRALVGRFAPKLDLVVQSIHGSKGLEADFVVLVGLDSGFRGFPDERSPEPLLDLVLPKLSDPNEEERRLLYVGLTRARHQVTLLADCQAPSEYIQELETLARRYHFIDYVGDVVQRQPCPRCHVGSLRPHPNNKRRSCTRTARCGYWESANVIVVPSNRT